MSARRTGPRKTQRSNASSRHISHRALEIPGRGTGRACKCIDDRSIESDSQNALEIEAGCFDFVEVLESVALIWHAFGAFFDCWFKIVTEADSPYSTLGWRHSVGFSSFQVIGFDDEG